MVDDWDELGDGGRIFNQIPPVQYEIGWANLGMAGEAYVTSVIYDLDVLRRYLTERVDGDALIIVLGDHQPSACASAWTSRRGRWRRSCRSCWRCFPARVRVRRDRRSAGACG
jgi:hypothetical protein